MLPDLSRTAVEPDRTGHIVLREQGDNLATAAVAALQGL